ncbi:MAG: cytochrome P450 [Qipengyuania sp.]|nr:cytochrome P450 [Qipengyuania sp.]
MATKISAEIAATHMPSDIAARIVNPKAYGEWNQLQKDFTWLRQNMPLSVAQAEGYDPFWMVTKYDDIQEIGRQPSIFANNGARKTLIDRNFAGHVAKVEAEGKRAVNRSLLTMDAPVHMRYRLITAAQFAPKGIKMLEQDIREIAREAIDAMVGHEEIDFLNAVSHRFPLRVILSLLQLPRSDEDMLLSMTQRFFNPRDTEIAGIQTGNSVGATSNHDVVNEMYDYFAALIANRRANPTGDLASVIANSTIDGQPIAEADAVSYYMTIATAGHDTTASSTAGAAWALSERPEEFAKVKADRSLIPSLVNEAIRWTSPVSHFMRTALSDYELRGQTIRAGDWLMLCYPSANRDEDIFEAPFEFRVDRAPNPQLAFGYGAHVCLGQHLAKMEMAIFFEEFFNRVESIELAGEPKRVDSILVGGLKRLPVRYKLAS